MSQYKSATRAQHQQQSSDAPYRASARQLQELFPSWPNDDLIQLLTDLNGDVTLAATKISDGTVEPWGEVSRKKDKKPATSSQSSKPSTSGRGDLRGVRGGRGGRGGPGRGGAVTRGRGGPPKANGHTHLPEGSSASEVPSSIPADSTKLVAQDASPKPSLLNSHDLPEGSSVPLNDSSSQSDSASTPASGVALARSSTTETLNGSAVASSKNPTKTPATSKLSWAQIARPFEKPTPPSPAPQPQTLAVTNVTVPPQLPAPSSSTPEPSLEPQQNGWEEPTTVEPPSWDDSTPTQIADDWPPATSTEPVVEPPQTEVASIPALESEPEHSVESSPPPLGSEVVPEELKQLPAVAVVAQSALPAQVTATPSPKLTSRPAATSHRSSTRHKIPDQPVTLPISFGTGIEKVGMQFGSLSLGDATPEPQNELQVPVPAASEPTPAPVAPQPKSHLEAPTLAPPPATAPPASTSLSSVFQHQQQQAPVPQHQIPTQALHTSQPPVPHHIPTSISQPLPTSQSTSLATASPLQQFAQQHQVIPSQQSPLMAASTQQQNQHHQTHHLQQQQVHTPHLPQQLQQNQTLHNYAQHGLSSQLETTQQAQSSTQQQPLQNATHSNYFRGSEPSNNSPYFQTPTPPVTQSQDTSYGSFGQGSQSQHHQQGSHLGSFSSNDYSYTDNARGFYDSYTQQPSFASRNQLGHDDVKGLTSAGQQPSTASLPPSSTQGPQSHSSQTANQPQPNTPQGPQQYPPPVPYYYTHAYPQNQYYGSPYSSGYVPQPFVKYPTMFQPGPPGPASAGNPSSKQPTNIGVGVQPQANPYNQSLYQQGGYDEYQGHPHHAQHQHNHSLGLGQGGIGVNSGDYGKPLYGSSGQTGMQGFMGLGGQTGTSSSGPTSNAGPRASTSPEAAYKPYASKDVGVSGGRGAPVPPGQGQVPQSQNQGPTGQNGPQAQGFYSGNRFSGNVGAAVAGGAAQQGGPQGHLGYPQGVNDNFYGYQPRQQQGYWQ